VDIDALQPVTQAETVAGWIHELARIHVASELQGYIIDLVEATRHHRDLMLGVSPRGALALQRASRALAASVGRSYVVPDDVKVLATAVLEHRLLLSSEAMMRGVNPADVLASILDTVPVPATRGD
jgi:MoxR-like ATPase